MEGLSDRIHARVGHLAAAGATSAQLAAAVADDWREIEAALSPIVGGRGFIAIVQRSLHLLDEPGVAGLGADPIDAWRELLAERNLPDVTDASARLLRVFCNLLVALIGGSLTERLLRPVWDRPIRAASDQDTTP